MKIWKILGLFFGSACLMAIAKITGDLTYSATALTCLDSQPEDSSSFGSSLAISDRYIAVGDPKINRVVIYYHKKSKPQLSRIKEIYPPKNSITDRIGYGFGSSLVFHQDKLIIDAYSDLAYKDRYISAQNDLNNYKDYGVVYSLNLNNSPNSLEKIPLPESIKLSGYSVTTFNNKIAIGATKAMRIGDKPGVIAIVNPDSLQVEKIIEAPSSEQKFNDFGFTIDGNNKYLLSSSRGLTPQGGAFLIDRTEKLTPISDVKDSTSSYLRAGYSIAVSNNFLAIGNGYRSNEGQNTLIVRKKTGRWSVIDVDNFGGYLDANESYILISTDREDMLPSSTYHLIHKLVKLKGDRIKTRSEIRWSWLPDTRSDARGIIYKDRLLLSYKRKVVLLSTKYLPRHYVINRFFCN